MIGVFVWFGLIFGWLAASMAFVIIFDEYRKHRLGRNRAWKEALLGAAVAFVIFLALSVATGYLLTGGWK